MPRFRTSLRVFAALLASAVFYSRPALAQETIGLAVGSKAPGAAVETLDGKPADIAQYIGKGPTVLEFWATWCPLCRKLEPQMQTLRERYKGRVRFVGVGVPQNQTPEKQLEHVTKAAMGGEFLFDRNSAAIAAYKSPHTSYVVVVDGAGTVVYTGVGADQDLETAVKAAFATPMKGKSN
jgi:thiol-disulfide isomerase/thioredoxin